MKQKKAKSTGNFGDNISLLRLDNSKFNKKEVLEVLDKEYEV